MYDGDRLVRTVVTREPEWSIEDVALLAAEAEYRDEIGPHGQPMSEASDPLADPNLRGQGWLYEAVKSEDYAQQAIVQAQKKLALEFPDDENLDRFIWGVVKKLKPPIPPTGG